MVRHKTRWMLVHLDLDNGTSNDMSRKDLATSIRQNIVTCLGLAGEGAALETQGMSFPPPDSSGI